MPANLPPEYHKIEAELRTARTPEEKIDIYERLIRVIPHHKGTDKLIAMYRQKIAKAREEGERRASTAKHAPTHKIEKTGRRPGRPRRAAQRRQVQPRQGAHRRRRSRSPIIPSRRASPPPS